MIELKKYCQVSTGPVEVRRQPDGVMHSLIDRGPRNAGEDLRRIAEHLASKEATEVYLPLSWLLYLHVSATQDLYRRAHPFLTQEETEVPYVVGVAGSVASGKSRVAQVLQALISRWPGNLRVELVSTDGFLYPNCVLRSRDLMDRKGFPESYDLPFLLRFWRTSNPVVPRRALRSALT